MLGCVAPHRFATVAALLTLLGAATGQRPVTDVHRAEAFYAKLGVDVHVAKGQPEQDPAPLVVLKPDIAAVERKLKRASMRFDELIASPSGARSLRVVDADGYATIFRTPRDADAAVVPRPGELNPLVLEVIARYPTDGTHRYWWPRGDDAKGWMGCTQDLEDGGEVFANGDPEGRAFCCGLTFEVFIEAWRLWCHRNGRPWRIRDLDVDGVRRLQHQWFGSASDKTCLRTAIVDNALGTRVEDWKDARAGDFVQLWRASGSGHSVVFLDWVREKGEIVGFRYWSTQTSTRGSASAWSTSTAARSTCSATGSTCAASASSPGIDRGAGGSSDRLRIGLASVGIGGK